MFPEQLGVRVSCSAGVLTVQLPAGQPGVLTPRLGEEAALPTLLEQARPAAVGGSRPGLGGGRGKVGGKGLTWTNLGLEPCVFGDVG